MPAFDPSVSRGTSMPARAKLAAALLAGFAATVLAVASAGAEPLGVTVRNESVNATCAETDNVTLKLVSDDVQKFNISVRHPAYVGMLLADNTAPDWETCDMSGDPVVPADAKAPLPPSAAAPGAKPGPNPAAASPAAPKRITIFETPDMWLTGFIFPSFWRAATVPVRIGGDVTQGLHMVQLWMRVDGKAEEVLVIYPPDGYMRARPMSPAHMRDTAYGSSFLVGPVEQAERPIVRLKEVGFTPQTRTFTLHYAAGGKARMQVVKVGSDELRLEVQLDGTPPGTFAALRSMYVTEGNADVARVAWRSLGTGKGGAGGLMGEAPVLSFADAQNVSMLWAGRLVPSRHNTSAPDFIFDGFSGR
ncbi:hypothetical protein [Xanthobacter aminoxidans]|uniref:Uncharacterized protein n=1 Tax=Xanthobacter aminoxidans TaxID=186280 RepID=A0ABW6ZBB3_9HYPH